MHKKKRNNYKYQGVLIGSLIHKKIIFFMKQFHAEFISQFNITIPKNSHIENLDSSKYNFQPLDSNCDKICVGNGRFFYFNDYGELYLYYIFKIRYPVIKNYS